MDITIKIEAVELVEALNNLAEAIVTSKEETSKKTTMSTKARASKKKVEETTAQKQQADPPAVSENNTCGTCESYTPDKVLTSIGKCDNPAGQNVNGWTPTDYTECNVYTPAQQPPVQQPPVQQPPVQQPPVQQPPVQQPPVQQPPVQQPPVQQMAPPTVVPTAPTTYKLGDIQLAAQQLMDAGKQQDLRNLLTAFNVPALVKLPPEQYANFATQLRAMGARI